MKKALALIALVAFAVSAQADIISRTWFSTALGLTPGGTGSEMQSLQTYLGNSTINGEGTSWLVAIYNSGDLGGTTLGSSDLSAGWGWYDGYGYNITGFNFTEFEGQDVVMRLYDAATIGAAGYYLDSNAYTLSDLTDPVAPGGTDVTFNFTGSTWQAVPEPATIGLFGLGAMGAWMLRRSKKSKEMADA